MEDIEHEVRRLRLSVLKKLRKSDCCRERAPGRFSSDDDKRDCSH